MLALSLSIKIFRLRACHGALNHPSLGIAVHHSPSRKLPMKADTARMPSSTPQLSLSTAMVLDDRPTHTTLEAGNPWKA